MAEPLDLTRRWYVVAGFIAFAAAYLALRPWNLFDTYMIAAPFGRDFVNFWFGGHLAWTGDLHLLFDLNGYDTAIGSIFHHQSGDAFIFSYPPHFLLFLAPFGALPYIPALLIWTALNIGCLVAVTRMFSRQWELALAVCLSPAALSMVLFAHFGGLIALAATVALLHGKKRPWLGGICLAFLSVKPQFAVLAGLFLLAAGAWRAVFAGVLLTVGMISASVAAFGWQPWRSFFEWTIPIHEKIIANLTPDGSSTTVSLYTGLHLAGVPTNIALPLQYAFSLIFIGGAILLMRNQPATPRTLTIVLIAVVAALPYSNHYDLVMAAPVFTLALFDTQAASEQRIVPTIVTLLLWQAPVLATISLLSWQSVPLANVTVTACLVLLMFQGYFAKLRTALVHQTSDISEV